MVEDRSSGTMLPPVQRQKRRDGGRVVAIAICVLFAIAAILPIAMVFLLRTEAARNVAVMTARKALRDYGIEASFRLEVTLWPLGVSVENVRIESNDRGAPFLEARSIAARPKLFSLIAGKPVIDQIELHEPRLRAVIEKGALQNLTIHFGESKPPSSKKSELPFSVISASDGTVDILIDGAHITARAIDADITSDNRGEEPAVEIGLRIENAETRMVRSLRPSTGGRASTSTNASDDPDYAVDEDVFCHLEARARIDSKRALIRRLSVTGAVDRDSAEETGAQCADTSVQADPENNRRVELHLGHFAIDLPSEKPASIPNIAGHVRIRAPLAIVNRVAAKPRLDGWADLDSEFTFRQGMTSPEMTGHLEGARIRIDRFQIAQSITSDFILEKSIATSPLTRIGIADGIAELRNTSVNIGDPGLAMSVDALDANRASFASLMRELGVTQHPHVTWDLDEVHAASIRGTLNPLELNGDLRASTSNFAVYDKAIDNPSKIRATGVREGRFEGKLAIGADALEFRDMHVRTPHSSLTNVSVSLGFREFLQVDVGGGTLDIADLSPLGSVKLSGLADLGRVKVRGPFNGPVIEGDIKGIERFAIGEFPFGNVTKGHIELHKLTVGLRDVRAIKGKSSFELTTGELDFSGPAAMRMDANVTSNQLDVRDFLNIFKLDDDPRLADLGGTLSTTARMHLALGGPEDICNGGLLDVQATVSGSRLNLLGERFDEGHAVVDYRWIDQKAGLEGANIDIRTLSLTKFQAPNKPPRGSVLGSLAVQRGGQLRGNLVVQGFPLNRADSLGRLAPHIEGSIAAVARVSGTLTAYEVQAQVDATPVRVFGIPLGSSNLHVAMREVPKPTRIIGTTACGAPIVAPFDKAAWLRDTSEHGSYTVSGRLFGEQLQLDNVIATRQKSPVISGKMHFARMNLTPIGSWLTTGSAESLDPSRGTPVEGEVSGDVIIDRLATDDISHARISFAPTAFGLTLRGTHKLSLRTSPITPASADGEPSEGLPVLTLSDDTLRVPTLTFDLQTPSGLQGTVSLGGAIAHATRQANLELDATMSPMDLSVLATSLPRVTQATGELSGAIRVRGTALSPSFRGNIAVRKGEIGIKDFPGSLSNVTIDLVADENEVRIPRATANFLGGDVRATAHAPWKNGSLEVIDAAITGRQLFFSPVDGLKTTLDADLKVTVDPNAATQNGKLPTVSGDITLSQFEYTKPIAPSLSLSSLRGSKRTVVDTYDPAQDSVNLAIDVHSRVPLTVHNNLIDAQVAIDSEGLRITGTNQRSGLLGQVTALPGGHVRLFANDFEIQQGTIRFEDPSRIAPNVDVTAINEYRRYSNLGATPSGGAATSASTTTSTAGATGGGIASRASGGNRWRIALHAYGDFGNYGDGDEVQKVDMTSDPPLSRDDIFYLLAFGLTRAELDQVRSSSAYAGFAYEAAGALSGVDRAVKQAIPAIDDFRLGTAYSPRTGRIEPNITVGRRLTESLRATVTTGISEDPQVRPTLEWRIGRTLSFEPSYDRINTLSPSSAGSFGLDLRWRLQFN